MEPPTFLDYLTAWSTFATAFFTAALAGIAGATAIFAWGTLKASRNASVATENASDAAREANDQARRDSIERTRPNVYVDVVPGMHGEGAYDVKIFNAGQSSARNLTLDLEEWPGELDDIAESVHTLMRTPRTLPPQCAIRAVWRLTGPFTDGTKEAGMPTQAKVIVRYSSDDPTHPQYEDEFGVDLDNSGLWPLPTGGPDVSRNMKPPLSHFYKLGQAMVRSVGELGRYK